MNINYEILKKHKRWLDGAEGGERANLIEAYLNGANLNGSNLTGAYLNWAYLNGADLAGANLNGACLTGADLTRANLTGAYLNGADLTRACLTGANLKGVCGNLKHIKSIFLERYPIAYTSDILQIGCQKHPITDWWEFEDDEIIEMDGEEALVWWKKWKGQIKTLIEMSPAEPTGV